VVRRPQEDVNDLRCVPHPADQEMAGVQLPQADAPFLPGLHRCQASAQSAENTAAREEDVVLLAFVD
jgi:hypothetical protein